MRHRKDAPSLAASQTGQELTQLLVDSGVSSDNRTPVPSTDLPLTQLVPNTYNPRVDITPESVERLAESIRTHGVQIPLLVRPIGNDTYEIMAGMRRFTAAQLAGKTTVPVRIIEADDDRALEIALLENSLREDLSPVEELYAVLTAVQQAHNLPTLEDTVHLINEARNRGEEHEAYSTVTYVVQLVGFANIRSFISNRQVLLNYPEQILKALHSGQLEPTHAQYLHRVKDLAKQAELLERTIQENLSRRALKELVDEVLGVSKPALQVEFDNLRRKFTAKRLQSLDREKKSKATELISQLNALLE